MFLPAVVISVTISIMVPISAAVKIPVAMPEYNHPIMVSVPAEMISVAIPIVITHDDHLTFLGVGRRSDRYRNADNCDRREGYG